MQCSDSGLRLAKIFYLAQPRYAKIVEVILYYYMTTKEKGSNNAVQGNGPLELKDIYDDNLINGKLPITQKNLQVLLDSMKEALGLTKK